MEDIAFILNKISIRQGIIPLIENRFSNCNADNFNNFRPVNIFDAMATSSVVATSSVKTDHKQSSSNEASEEDDEKSIAGGGIGTLSQRRSMPSRASKENSMSKVKRRTIMRPTKRDVSRAIDFSSMRFEDVKKIYLNQKLTNFRPSKLETIFEEPQESSENCAEFKFIGPRKIKRSLSCSDGLNINKSVIKQRRAKIKKTFGRRLSIRMSKKKFAINDFIERLNKSVEEETKHESKDEINAAIDIIQTNTIACQTSFSIKEDRLEEKEQCLEITSQPNFLSSTEEDLI
ncbi:protein tantalus [Teleopsis dalmanni]|uniref:protein tantalus n=1 Tax=Teleopsis dalmanni TaxID=139649 RepID=UPI000D329F64|nr:protein tantalus [Teleopsis dalmanni]